MRKRKARLPVAVGSPSGAHHHAQAFRRHDAGVVGLADAGAVLGRDPGAVVDGLTLAEQEALGARGLRRLEPLQRACVGRGFVLDLDLAGAVELDGHRRAVVGANLPDGVGGFAAAGAHRADHQPVMVEHDFARVGARGDAERGLAVEDLAVEVGGEVERDVGDARFVGAGVGAGVVRQRRKGAAGASGGAGGHERCDERCAQKRAAEHCGFPLKFSSATKPASPRCARAQVQRGSLLP
jgi:hypothetical protein